MQIRELPLSQIYLDTKTHRALGELLHRPLHLPAEERRDADDRREYPDQRDHDGGPGGSPLLQVVDGLRDGPVAVQRDEAEVHDGGGRQKHVHGRVYVAPEVAEYPVAHQLVGERERHDHEAEEEVGDGQTGYEPVLDVLQGFLRGDRDDHQHVPDDDDDHQHGDHDGREDDRLHRVPARVHRVLPEDDVRVVRIVRAIRAVHQGDILQPQIVYIHQDGVVVVKFQQVLGRV